MESTARPDPSATGVNADPAELAKFSQHAPGWWDAEGDFKSLHEVNPLRLRWIDQQAAIAGKRVLDVGCGGGILAESMAKLGAQVTGIDLARDALKVAQLHAMAGSVGNVRYREIAVEALAAESPSTFDVVTCMEMLEHVPDPASVVQACATLARPGGWVFFSTLQRTAKAWLAAIVAAEHVLKLLPKGTHEYDKLIRAHELAGWCRAAGLAPQSMIGVGYNPLTRRYLLTPDTSINYMLACRVPA